MCVWSANSLLPGDCSGACRMTVRGSAEGLRSEIWQTLLNVEFAPCLQRTNLSLSRGLLLLSQWSGPPSQVQPVNLLPLLLLPLLLLVARCKVRQPTLCLWWRVQYPSPTLPTLNPRAPVGWPACCLLQVTVGPTSRLARTFVCWQRTRVHWQNNAVLCSCSKEPPTNPSAMHCSFPTTATQSS